MAEVFDLEKHEKNKLKFLEALYDIAKEDIEREYGSCEVTDIGEEPEIVGRRAGLTQQESDRINRDLEHDELLMFASTRHCMLTRLGRDAVEAERYQKTFKAKRRKAASWFKNSAKSLLASVWGGVITVAGAYIAGVLTSEQLKSLLRWIGALFSN